MKLLLTMLSVCGRFLDAVFPYTSARLHDWVHLLYHFKLNTLDHQSLIPPALHLCLYVLETLFGLYGDRTGHQDQDFPAWSFVGDALESWLVLYQVLDILSALAVVLTTPGYLAKLMVALDLCFDLVLTCIAKLSSALFLGVCLILVATVINNFTLNIL